MQLSRGCLLQIGLQQQLIFKAQQAGMSLVEMVVVTGMSGLIGLSVMKISDVTNTSVKTLTYATELSQLKLQALSLASSEAILKKSWPSSTSLANCMQQGNSCAINSVFPYALNTGVRVFAGPATAPIYYDRKGTPCNPATGFECEITASAEFKPLCLDGGASCGTPQVILSTIRFRNTRLNKLLAEVNAGVFVRDDSGKTGTSPLNCGLNADGSYPVMVSGFQNSQVQCGLIINKIRGAPGDPGRPGNAGPQGPQGNPGPQGPPPS